MAIGPDQYTGVSRIGLLGIHPRDGSDATQSFREAMKQGDDALKRYVAQYYQGAGWRTDEIIKGLMETTDFYASEIVQVKSPNLYKGRFVLVGDAGYAPSNFTGAGTTLAIAGAYLLAGEISKHKSDLAAGLRGYEERMWSRSMSSRKSHRLYRLYLHRRRLGEYGYETQFSLSSLGLESWTSLRDSSPTPLPALISTHSRTMNGIRKGQACRGI